MTVENTMRLSTWTLTAKNKFLLFLVVNGEPITCIMRTARKYFWEDKIVPK